MTAPQVLLGWVGDAEISIQNNEKKPTPLNGQQEFSRTGEPPENPEIPSLPGFTSALGDHHPTYYIPPPTSPALPCWGSSASRRPGTGSAGMLGPT